MAIEVRTIETFDRNFKRLSRKYPSLIKDLSDLVVSLKEQPEQGTSVGGGCRKIRLAISSKGKGKSGGGRVITYLAHVDEVVYLLTIYDKSEQEAISRNDLLELRNMIP